MASNGKIPMHTDRVRELAKYISEQPDDEPEEITATDLLEAVRAGAVIATGSHQAMSKQRAEEITLTDHGKPSEPPPSAGKASPVVAVIKSVNNPYALGALALLVVALWVWLTKR